MSIQNTLALTALPVADSYDLLLTAAATLHENGEETHGTLVAIKQFGQQLGLETTLSLTWGELVLQVAGEGVRVRTAVPTDTNMRRVLATQRADLHAKSAVSFFSSKEQCQL